MNLKRTLFTGLAAVGLMASLAAPVSLAQDTATVTIVDSGVFDPHFCTVTNVSVVPDPSRPGKHINTPAGVGGDSQGVALGNVNVTSAGGKATGFMGICYTDTKTDRQWFKTQVSAGDFTSGTNVIPASGFTITNVYNPVQDQWGWTNPSPASPISCPFVPGGAATPGSHDIGDIGSLLGSGSTYATGNYVTDGVWPWSTTGGDLSTAPFVGYGWAGVGTGNGNTCTNGMVNGTVAAYGVELTIPAGSPAGAYASVLTLTVNHTDPNF